MSKASLDENIKELLEMSKKLREANQDLRKKNKKLKTENIKLRKGMDEALAVSYTHLTLPTKRIV